MSGGWESRPTAGWLVGSLSLAVFLSAASFIGQQPQPKPPSPFRITGVVLNSRDNAPVRRCEMTATLTGSARRGGFREPATTETDENGRFTLELPSAGDWQVSASAHNIRHQQFEEHEGFFTGVVLTTQSPAYDLVFRAVPDAIMHGTVTDEAGEPVRNAQMALFSVDSSARQTGSEALRQSSATQTDDRGYYEFASLGPGSYLVEAQARPWYADSVSRAPQPATQTSTPSPDPSLDVVYPSVWYPGVTESASADILTAHPGDSLVADFRLTPAPSAHLTIPSRDPQPTPTGRTGRNGDAPPPMVRQNPNISLLLPNGLVQPVFGQFSRNSAGDLDIGGLAPGTYQVAMPGSTPDSPGTTSIVHVTSGGSTIELGAASPTSSVTIAVDGGTNLSASQIILRSTTTGQVISASDHQEMGFGGQRPQGTPAGGANRQTPQSSGPGFGSNNQRARQGGLPAGPGQRGRGRRPGEDAKLQIPPGAYEVSVASDSSVFITGITAKGAAVTGRTVTFTESAASLTVHLASGLAEIAGTALVAGKPVGGAMVLLVPATLGDPASLTIVRRDQSDSDGSFRLESVIPGQYILLAIDHGWGVRWTDSATLRPYLMQGTPLDLHSSAHVTPKLNALTP